MKKKRRKAKLIPRFGPPQNLRPAGAHESKKRYSRKRKKADLERYDEDGFFVLLDASARAETRRIEQRDVVHGFPIERQLREYLAHNGRKFESVA